jgi:hypothetical protein
MAALSLAAYLLWGMSIITMILIVIGVACLLPVIYAWWLSRWIDKELDKELMSSEKQLHNRKTESNP